MSDYICKIADLDEINRKTEEIGYNMGKRLLDDIIDDLKDKYDPSNSKMMEILIKQLLQNYLGILPEIKQISEKEYHILFVKNPISFYVELPEHLNALCYSNIICGIIRGMLEVAGYEVTCEFVKDTVKDDDVNDIKLTFVKIIEEVFIDDEE